MFHGRSSTTVPARSMVVSDPAELDVPALSDLAISLFLPKTTEATTLHILAMQTSYVSSDTGDSTADVKFPVAKTIRSWPFLTGVDVAASAHGAAIVAFGSSLTDGDGSTLDTNRRWPDVLAARLQKGADGMTEAGVLNQGSIGNRQHRRRGHQNGIRLIGTTNPPFDNAFLVLSRTAPPVTFYSPEREIVRQKVNDWIRSSGEFADVLDFDVVLQDPSHPTRL